MRQKNMTIYKKNPSIYWINLLPCHYVKVQDIGTVLPNAWLAIALFIVSRDLDFKLV